MSKSKEECTTIRNRSNEEKQSYRRRLNRIEGQLNGISKMIDEDRMCNEILIQISAASMSLKSLGQEILQNHIKTCIVEDINNERYESIDEIMELCRRLM